MAERERRLLEQYLEARRQNPGRTIRVPDDVYSSPEFAQVRSDRNLSSILQEVPGSREANAGIRKFEQDIFSSPDRLQRVGQLAGIKLPEPKRSFNPLAALGNALNIINPVDAIVRARETSEPDFLKQFTSSIGRRAEGVRKGQFVQEKTGKDLLESFGVIQEGESEQTFKDAESKLRWLGIRGTGLAVDIFADPLTYITFGTGATAKIGTKAVTKAGERAFSELAERTARETSEQLARKGIDKPFEDILQGTINNLRTKAPEVGSRTESLTPYLDEGGVKVFGKTVIPTETIKRAASTVALSRAGKVIGLDKAAKGYQAVADIVGPMFSKNYFVPKAARPFVDKYHASRLNGMSSATDEVLNVLKSAGIKGTLNKDQQLRISLAIDSRNFDELTDPIERSVAEGYAGLLNKVRDDDLKAGVLAYSLENYLPLKYGVSRGKAQKILSDYLRENPTKITEIVNKLDPAVAGSGRRMKQLGSLRGAEQRRLIDDLPTAIRLGLEPETDPTMLVLNRVIASKLARAEKDFALQARDALKFNLLPDDIETALVSIPKIVTKDGRKTLEQKSIRVPKYVSEAIDQTRSKLINSDAVNDLLSGYDRLLAFWKGSVTVLFPAFHIRNGISNIAQNALDIGLGAIDPRIHKSAIEVMAGGKNVSITDRLGRKWTGEEIRQEMEKNGILKGTFFQEDIEREAAKSGTLLGQSRKLNPANIMRNIGSHIEDEAKVVNFIKNLERSGDATDAAQRVNRFLFDYSHLAPFEKEVMRRLIPFYTFGRKNFELQLRTLLTNPKAISSQFKAVQALTEPLTENQFDALPDYIQESLGLKFGEDEYGRPQFITGLGLPIEEFAARLKGKESAKELLSSTSPIIRAPLELIAGKDFFYDRPIDEITKAPGAEFIPEEVRSLLGIREVKKNTYVGGKKQDELRTEYHWDPKILYALRALPTSRFQSTLGLLGTNEKSAFEKAVRTSSGIKFYSVDEQEAEFFKTREDIEQKVNELVKRGIIKRDSAGRPRFVVDPETQEVLMNIDESIYGLKYKDRPSQLQTLVAKAEAGDPAAKIMIADIIENPDIIGEAQRTEAQFFKREDVGPIPSMEAIQSALTPTQEQPSIGESLNALIGRDENIQ